MSRLALLLFATALFWASAAHAEGIPAGFAPGPVWLSKTNLTDGDTAEVFTVVYNSSASEITGTVAFAIDGATADSETFDLPAGATKVEQTAWTAKEGTHVIAVTVANVADKDTKEPVTLEHATGGEISVTVAAAPPPSAAVQAASTAANIGADVIASSTPIISSIASTAENVRTDIADYLTQKANATSGTGSGSGQVLGAATYKAPAATSTGGVSGSHTSLLASVSGIPHMIYAALAFVASSPLWFYLLCIIVLYLLYKLVRVMFQDRKNRRSR